MDTSITISSRNAPQKSQEFELKHKIMLSKKQVLVRC